MGKPLITHNDVLKLTLLSGQELPEFGVVNQVCELHNPDPVHGRTYPPNSAMLCTLYVHNNTTGETQGVDFLYRIENVETSNMNNLHEFVLALMADLNTTHRITSIAAHLSDALRKKSEAHHKEHPDEIASTFYGEKAYWFINAYLNKYGSHHDYTAEIVPITLCASTTTGGVLKQLLNSAPSAVLDGCWPVPSIALANNVLNNPDGPPTHLLTQLSSAHIWVDKAITLEFESGMLQDANLDKFEIMPLSADLYAFECVQDNGEVSHLYMFWDDACVEPTDEYLKELVTDQRAFGTFGFSNRLISPSLQALIARGDLTCNHVHKVFLEGTYSHDYDGALFDLPEYMPTVPF